MSDDDCHYKNRRSYKKVSKRNASPKIRTKKLSSQRRDTFSDSDRSRSRSPKTRRSRSSSRGTFEGLDGSTAVALRGIGRCPHGPPVKCKNFPQCPGAKCIYSHSMCRYESSCNKQSCPFDHPNRPRTCMSCVNDMKVQSKRKKC
ncbi:unnamed protein product [Caenorhabditis sp. 36 PRJEB53466]|nr:unnamed protein product [Caenorhabditis sp. 36 PRJEB53466]